MDLKLTTCLIRLWKIDVARSIATQADNRKIWLNLRDLFPHPYTIEDAESYLDIVVDADEPDSYAIEVEGLAVGGISAHRQSDVHRLSAELGYWLGEEYWGRGIMTEAIDEFTKYLFEVEGVHRVFALPFSSNTASKCVLEKAGYTYEGCARGSVIKDGRILDQLIYAKIAHS